VTGAAAPMPAAGVAGPDGAGGEPAVRARGLTKRVGPVLALDSLDLDVPRGSIFGLLGPNGAGKSTLMRTIATLQEPDGGSIHLDAIDALHDKMALRRVLGYLPQ